MTPAQFQKIVLSFPEVIESQHMGHADFRLGGKIIASLGAPDEQWGMVKLAPEQQQSLCQSDADCFQPCNGAWGRQGYTNVRLSKATTATVRASLRLAVDLVTDTVSRKRSTRSKPASGNPASSESKSKLVRSPSGGKAEFDDTKSVNAFLKELQHPLKPLIEEIRATIVKADKRITEGIKWNVPSCYCHGWFATFHLRAKAGVVLVLHHGAKIRSESTIKDTIKDPAKLLDWASADRATITFTSTSDFKPKQKALKSIIKQWVTAQAELASRN